MWNNNIGVSSMNLCNHQGLESERNMGPVAMYSPQQGALSPLHANYYQLRIRWNCSECWNYTCRGQAWFDLNESADASFTMLRTVGGIKQFHKFSSYASDPYQATLTVNRQHIATSNRISRCCAPECEVDEVNLTFGSGAPLGSLYAKGDCRLKIRVFSPQGAELYRVEMKCCNKCCSQEFKIYDHRRQVVGKYFLEDDFELDCIIANIQLPVDAAPETRIILIFAAHYAVARMIEHQQSLKGH